MTTRLVAISAFYKNDRPEGIGISIDESFGNLDNLLDILTASYNAMWDECQAEGSLPALIGDLRSQLTGIGSSKPHYGIAEVSIIIGNIYLLEKHGQMVTDEFNGLQLAYVEN
jgi:hypothetical protein